MNISVIIPVHNSEKYLEECVGSVLPGLKEDDEIILVENGSEDSSWDLCRQYAEKYPNIRAVHLDQPGVSHARNKGIVMARGFWLVFLDSDDIMAPGFLEAAHRADPAGDLILFNYCFLGEEGTEPEDKGFLRPVDPDLLRRGALQFGRYQTAVREEAGLDNVTIWSCCAKLISRDLVRRNRIHFPERLCLSEDTIFSFQLYCSADRIYSSGRMAFYYRRTPSSASRIHHPRTLENNRYLRKWVRRYADDRNLWPELGEELTVFLARKLVEECLHLTADKVPAEDKVSYVRRQLSDPFTADTIKRVGYAHLIAGKRNNLLCGSVLFLLKRRLYGLLYIRPQE